MPRPNRRPHHLRPPRRLRRLRAATRTNLISKLKELATLKDQGILTEAEFNDQKAKILAQMS